MLYRIKRQSEQEEHLANSKKSRKQEAEGSPAPAPVKKTKQPKHIPAASEERYSNKAQILRMHEEGMEALDIAQRLNLGVGEVRLVIELNKER